MTEVYLVVTTDRHTDVGIDVYRSPDQAISIAKMRAAEYAKYNNSGVLDPDGREEDCLYRGVYSCEYDNVAVYRRIIQ